MRSGDKRLLLGMGAGIALTLIAVQINALYWQNKKKKDESTSNYAAYHYSSTRSYLKLDSPSIPGYQASAEEIREYEGWFVHSLDGNRFRISDLKGKVVFINIWATWCVPCVVEMPGIEKLTESLRNEPIVFLLVTDEDPERVGEYLKTAPASLPVFLANKKQQLPRVFGKCGRPATFILDRNGMVVFRQIGSANWDQDRVRMFLRGLLKQ